MNTPTTSTEIEAVIKNLPKNQKPSTKWFHRRILSNIQIRANAYLSKTLSKNCRERNTSKLILQGHHHPDTKTRQRQHKKENYRSISLMNINAKSSAKFQQTEFSNTSKSSYTMIKLGLFQESKNSLIICKSINVIHHINKLKDKNRMIISIDTEKAFDKIQHQVMVKSL